MSQLHGIQALRALAAFMVAVHHAQNDALVVAQRAGTSFTPSTLVPWMAGVDIFFVVSGFIMVHASAGLAGQAGGARLFLLRRMARIVPLYWAATTLFLLTVLVLPKALNSAAPTLGQIASAYLFWPAISSEGLIQPVYSLGWTLNYEMLFYLLFGAGLLLPARWLVSAVGLALAALVGVEALAGPLPLPLGFWGQPIVLEFAAGMVIATLRNHGLQLGPAMRAAVAALGFIVLLAAPGGEEASGAWSSAAWHGSAATLLVLAAACGVPRQASAPPMLRALTAVGDASYALYLIHPFVIRGLREVVSRMLPGSALAFILIALAAAVAVALLAHRVFEKPATRWVRRRLRV